MKWRLGYSRQIGIFRFIRFELVAFETTIPKFWNGVVTISQRAYIIVPEFMCITAYRPSLRNVLKMLFVMCAQFIAR